MPAYFIHTYIHTYRPTDRQSVSQSDRHAVSQLACQSFSYSGCVSLVRIQIRKWIFCFFFWTNPKKDFESIESIESTLRKDSMDSIQIQIFLDLKSKRSIGNWWSAGFSSSCGTLYLPYMTYLGVQSGSWHHFCSKDQER